MKNPLPIVVSAVVAIVSYGGFISMLAQSSVQAATSTVRLYVTPTTAGVTVGQTTPMQLRLYKDSTTKVDYVDAKLTFSTANLEVASISKQGSHFNYSNGPSTSYSNSNGTISVTGTGGELPTQSDVLVATVTFKGKAAGSGSLSYSAASAAGDMTNGGHVKNALDSRVGGVVNVSNPIASSGGSTPSNPGTPTQPATPPTTNSDEPVSSSDPTSVPDGATEPVTDTSAVEPQGMNATLEQTVAKPPVWLQFLLPAAGVAGVLGMGGLGAALYLKRRASGVTLPPIEGEELGIPMPTTETEEEQSSDVALAGNQTADSTDSGDIYTNPDRDLGEFSAQRELDYTAPLDTIAPSAERLDVDVGGSNEPAAEPTIPQASEPIVAQPPVELESVLPPEQTSQLPLPTEPILPPEENIVAQSPPPPVIAEPPVPIQSAPQLTPEPVNIPVSTFPVVEVAQQISVAQPSIAPPATNLPDGMPSTMDTTPQSAGSRVAEEYADLPDMFDVGAQRLAAEGHGDLKPAGS
jgi:hypothetical protein